MPTIANWISSLTTATNRAVDAWARIQDKPTSIVIRRAGTDLDAQTMRLEYNNMASMPNGESIGVSSMRIVVFGVKDHPDPLIEDTDIQSGDRFNDDDGQWEIDTVINQFGEVQGIGRRITA